MYEPNGTRTLVGAEVIVDKDRASALLAREIEVDVFVMATDVDGVYLDWGTPQARRLERTTPEELRAHDFPAGSMGPKVEAACDFVERTGGIAAIGALADIEAIVEGRSGTVVHPAWICSPALVRLSRRRAEGDNAPRGAAARLRAAVLSRRLQQARAYLREPSCAVARLCSDGEPASRVRTACRARRRGRGRRARATRAARERRGLRGARRAPRRAAPALPASRAAPRERRARRAAGGVDRGLAWLPALRRADRFWPWLVGIASHKAADIHRRRARTVEAEPEVTHDDDLLLETRQALSALPAPAP